MGVLERTKHVVRADLNDLLRKAKNPEVVLDAYLDDLETVLEEAKSIQSAEEAERDMYAARLRDMQATQETWERKAAACLQAGDEDLARTSLRRRVASHRPRALRRLLSSGRSHPRGQPTRICFETLA